MPLNSPDIKELQAIVDWVNLTDDVRELSIKFGDVELFISRDRQSSGSHAALAPAPHVALPAVPAPHAASAPAPHAASSAPAPHPASSAPATAAPAPSAAPTAPAPAAHDALAADEVVITSPMVGTFYASPKPGDPNFVSIGDTVIAETVLCIVEVMKLMNNIEAQIAGTVTKILVEDNQAVEYGQPLMVVKRAA